MTRTQDIHAETMEMYQDYLRGYSVAKVAWKYGYPPPTVQSRFRSLNLPRRSKGPGPGFVLAAGNDSMKPVTPKAIAVYEFIEKTYRLTEQFPTYEEINGAFGWVSKCAAKAHVRKLRIAGWLEVKGVRAYTLLREPKTYYIRKESESDTNISN